MPVFDCIAVGCGAGIRRGYLMCMTHWQLVPPALRNKLDELRRESPPRAARSLAYKIAETAAVRHVALTEGTRSETDETVRARDAAFEAARSKLRAELGPRYSSEINPYTHALLKLMRDSAVDDPLFVVSCASTFDPQDAPRTARRIAAALEVRDRRAPKKGVSTKP